METRKRSRLAEAGLVGMVLALLAGQALAGSVSYTYDALGRLNQATHSNGIVITYAYDAMGNRSSTIVSGAPAAVAAVASRASAARQATVK